MRIAFLIILLLPMLLMAQKRPLELRVQDGDEGFVRKQYRLKEGYDSWNELTKDLQVMLLALYDKGYVSASVDTIEDLPDKYVAWVFVGKQYEWVALHQGNVEEEVLDQTSYKERQFTGTKLNLEELTKLLNSILTYHENNGYPFARVGLDSIYMDGNGIEASLKLEENQLMSFDTFAVTGDAKVNKKYLQSYLGIKPGELYDESLVQNISRRLAELPFLAEERPATVTFVQDKARVNLYLMDRKASQFDFLIGILPNNEVTGRVLVTGDANLNLVNPFGTGKEIRLNWRKLQAGTQFLDVGFVYPYMLQLPLGADLDFNLYKRDTLFLDIEYEIGLQYLFLGRNYLKAFVHNKATNVITVDTATIIRTRNLPEYNDVRNTLYGLEGNYQKLDYAFNPRRGTHVNARAGIGTKRIKENNGVTELQDEATGGTFGHLYDSLGTKNLQYQVQLRFAQYFPVKQRSTVMLGFKGAALFTEQVFQNEQFRIGGTKVLRGFDEESIFATLYAVATLEYRFLLSKNSYFNVFFDGAYVEESTLDNYSNSWPYGFGAGLSFETKAGMFGISYAIGSRDGDTPDVRSAKIHFGYYNYF